MKSRVDNSTNHSSDLEKVATPAVRAKLGKLGIVRAQDLLTFFPIRYEDETQVFNIADAPERELVQIEVTVIHARVEFRPRRQLVVAVQDATGMASLRFLNFYPSQQRMLEAGVRIRVVGEFRMNRQRIREMIHPRYKKIIDKVNRRKYSDTQLTSNF